MSEHDGTLRDLRWSQAEKVIARKAFELALEREFASVMDEFNQMMLKVKEAPDLWDIEHYLTERRKGIDRKYDYRYSVLPQVFGCLIRDGRLKEEELQGLGEDKLDYIRQIAAFRF